MISIYEPGITPYTESAISAIKSGWISNHGIYVDKSKALLQSKFNVKHAILMANGTCATHCLFLALKYKHPTISKIYVPNNAYVAAWNTALMSYKEEQLEVMEMDERTWSINTSIQTLDPNSAVLIVHNLGNIVNVPRLAQIRPDLVFIEDNCEGFTGKYNGIYSGTSETTLCSSASFYGNKIITTGEGGVFMTQHTDIYEYINRVYSQGMSDIRYIHDIHAYNYRMTNIEAAFLYDQLNDLENIILKKQGVFDRYKQMFSKIPNISVFSIEEDTQSANWMFAIRLHGNQDSPTEFFRLNGVDIRPFFYPIERHKHLAHIKKPIDHVPELLNREIIMIPSSPNITITDQYKITNTIIKFLLHNDGINIEEITKDNKKYIYDTFLSKIKDSSFRYFDKRPMECIDLHTYSIVLLLADKYIGYAHIDQGWFGIYIENGYRNRGLGSLIVQYILNYCRIENIQHLQLSVDKSNQHAICLYAAGGFAPLQPPDQEQSYYVMDNPSLRENTGV